MARRPTRARYRTLRFRKSFRAPLSFVYRWCTDYRDDDDRITDDIYPYRAKVILREPDRVVRVISVPGTDRNRNTDVEIISMRPQDRWHLVKLSVSDDETGDYRLTRKGPELTGLEMRFRSKWKVRRLPDANRYRALFHRAWDRYVEVVEAQYARRKR
ncbi:MAG: hypothetical protein ACREDE_04375 [Thermoplasmata archaeon]